jgi:hypothetical protein
LRWVGFPNQFFCDSWVVGFCRADHGWHDIRLEGGTWTLSEGIFGSAGTEGAATNVSSLHVGADRSWRSQEHSADGGADRHPRRVSSMSGVAPLAPEFAHCRDSTRSATRLVQPCEFAHDKRTSIPDLGVLDRLRVSIQLKMQTITARRDTTCRMPS